MQEEQQFIIAILRKEDAQRLSLPDTVSMPHCEVKKLYLVLSNLFLLKYRNKEIQQFINKLEEMTYG